MFKHFHILPDEVGRQSPSDLFDMLEGLNSDDAASNADNYSSPYIRAVFG